MEQWTSLCLNPKIAAMSMSPQQGIYLSSCSHTSTFNEQPVPWVECVFVATHSANKQSEFKVTFCKYTLSLWWETMPLLYGIFQRTLQAFEVEHCPHKLLNLAPFKYSNLSPHTVRKMLDLLPQFFLPTTENNFGLYGRETTVNRCIENPRWEDKINQ